MDADADLQLGILLKPYLASPTNPAIT